MTKLSRLRSRLVRLQHRRWRIRLATAYCALMVAVLVTLAVAMLFDWLLDMSPVQRLVALGVCFVAVVWAFYRYTLPWLGSHENELDMALLIQQQEHIDSDLVAALQFESSKAGEWGSVQLEEAVIDHVADIDQQLNIFRALPRRPLWHRVELLAVVVTVWAAVWLFFPGYVETFVSRLLLKQRHYPTRTVIDAIAINGQSVDTKNPGACTVKIPAGSAAQFSVTCRGRLPANGEVRLASLAGEGKVAVPLDQSAEAPHEYAGQHARLAESVKYQVYLGDTCSEPGQLIVVPAPLAALEMEVLPPSYALSGATAGKMPPGMRQVSVIEGSRVILRLESKKPLADGTLSIGERRYRFREETAPTAEAPADRWICDAPDTPLAAVVEPIQFSIQITDKDGLQMEQPIQGAVRIQPDQPPRIAGGTITPFVLPTAMPKLFYRATDDFGLSRIALVQQVIHADGQAGDEVEVQIYQYNGKDKLHRDLEGRYPLDLKPLKLVKDDQLKVTLKAVDYRGERPGQATLGEPMLFHVTDLEGILTMMTESDRKSAEQLKTMIQRQLGIEEEKIEK